MSVFDSIFKGDLSSSLTHQLAVIYRGLIVQEEDGVEVDPYLKIHVPAIQQQSGGNDCGIFAIAFALHSLLGETLETVEFDQSKMRGHLLECLKKKELVRFPTKQKLGFRSRHFPYREVELFCECLMPDTWKDTMIECEGCNRWYHTECVGLMSLSQATEQWTCSLCTI